MHQLTAAASFAEESLYLYHYVAATEHPGGTVATTSIAADGQMESTLDLSYEPSGISAYLILHPDTSQGHQRVGFGITLDPDHITEVRVRQYNNSSSDQYYDALGWQTITTAGDQQLLVPVDKASVLAGGKTILELRISKIGGGTFAGGKNATLFNPYTFITTYVPESRIATICDEPDNYRFGFNGQEKDNEAKGLGNSLNFSFRIHDPRLGRFMSLDPLANRYPGFTPYGFAQSNPISGIDLEGLEYLGHNQATVEFKYGELRLKVENFTFVTKGKWYHANRDSHNWGDGNIGLNKTIGNVSFIAPKPELFMPDIEDMTEIGAAKSVESYKSSIGANKSDQRPGIVGPTGRAGALTKGSVVIDAAVVGLKGLVNWAGSHDADLVEKHSIIANKVAEDVKMALNKGMIPEKYQNREGISNIMNVVLQGENNTKDPEVYKIGMNIFNMANPKTSGFVPSGLDNFRGRVVPIQQPANDNSQQSNGGAKQSLNGN